MKKRKQPKPNAAQRKLAEDWEKMLARHSKPLELGAKAKGITAKPVDASLSLPKQPVRSTQETFDKLRGSTAPRDTQQYTGTKMLGIGGLHKSNQVPVFSAQEADDLAHMRR